jgi:hypothetical protein
MALKKNLPALLVLVLLCITGITLLGQDKETDTTRYFYKPEWKDKLKQKPNNQKKWQDFELHARMYAKYAVPEEKTLPLIFNIVNGREGKKINPADIKAQIDVLNDAFAGIIEGNVPTAFSKVRATDTKIRFCQGSPKENKSGSKEKSSLKSYNVDNLREISSADMGIAATEPSLYINIWIVELEEGLGGYAIMPDHDAAMDGIYIDPDYFGTKKNSKYY